jgi:hypothetical protein
MWESKKLNSLREICQETSKLGEMPLRRDTVHAVLNIRKKQLENGLIDKDSFADHMDKIHSSPSLIKP